jgi:hypothetical protein
MDTERNRRKEASAAIEAECTSIGFNRRANSYFTKEFTVETARPLGFSVQ